MSMELYVLSDRRLESIDAWQFAIDANGFPLRLSSDMAFEKLHGVLPAWLNGRQTAFECGHWDAAELMAESPDIDFGSRWKYALSFRWGSNVYDGIAAYIAGGAYAKATRGVLLDCEENKIISSKRAGEIAGELERGIPLMEEAMRRMREKLGH
ncbi:MAG: hypothetical protein HY242_02385 [Afipia sp.]|nr:hypothetical protein [Afipia sp.]